MACLCGVHICWVCLKPFDEPNGVYDHLRLIHRGAGGDEQLDLAYARLLQREEYGYVQEPVDPEFQVDDWVTRQDPEYEESDESDKDWVNVVADAQGRFQWGESKDRRKGRFEWNVSKGHCIIM